MTSVPWRFPTRDTTLIRSPRPHSPWPHTLYRFSRFLSNDWNFRTSDRNSSAFCSWSWGPFSTLGLLRPTDFLHLYQNKLRLIRCRLDHSKAVTSSTYHRCYKEIRAFCLLHRRDFLRSQQTVWLYGRSEHCHQFSILFMFLKFHSNFGLLYCRIINRCRTTWIADWTIARSLPLVQ